MKLNHNSISARLYRWFYIKDEMPQTLCPYFWKLAIMWILIIPYGLLSLPVIIGKNEIEEWGTRALAGLFGWGILFCVFLALFTVTYFFWGWFDPKTTFGSWQMTGILIWMMTITSTIVLGIIHLNQKRGEKEENRQREYIWNENGEFVKNPDYAAYEERSSIIVEFIKAKYNKYCPKIDWE